MGNYRKDICVEKLLPRKSDNYVRSFIDKRLKYFCVQGTSVNSLRRKNYSIPDIFIHLRRIPDTKRYLFHDISYIDVILLVASMKTVATLCTPFVRRRCTFVSFPLRCSPLIDFQLFFKTTLLSRVLHR